LKHIWLSIGNDLPEDEIAMYSPMMVNSYAARSDEGIKHIAGKFYKQIRGIKPW
jgi:hypothetical protein